MNTFDGKFYLDNLDHVITSILENNKKAGVGKNISGYFNCAFGDKHWYDNETAFKVVQYYLWEATFDSIKDAKIIQICQKLETNYNLSSEERFQLSLAKRVCSPLPNPSERVLFNLVADEFGAGSQLEGAQSAEIIEYIVKFINARNARYKIDAELMKEIQTAMVLSLSIDQEENSYTTATPDFITKAREKLTQAFKTGQPSLLPGGWVGKPSGHAMYYEVVPQNDGTASFRLYNLGSGIDQHQRAILFGKSQNPKVKTAPYLEWKGIEPQRLLSEGFFKSLYEMQKYREIKLQNTEYNASDIYQGLREYLMPMHEGVVDLTLFKSDQDAGTCTCQSFLAFLATRLPSKIYKRIVRDLGLVTLTTRTANTSISSQRELNLTKKCHQKLSRKIQKSYNEKMVNEKSLHDKTQKLSQIKKKIKAAKENEAQKLPFTHIPLYEQPGESISDTIVTKSIPILHKQYNLMNFTPLLQPETKCYLQLKELAGPLSKQIEAAEKICLDGVNNRGYEALELGLVEWLLTLPSKREELLQVLEKDPEELKRMIAVLGNISRTYFKNCFLIQGSECVHPKRLYVLKKLLWMQMTLAEQAEEGWKAWTTLSTQDFLFNFFDARVGADFNQVDLQQSCADSRHKINLRFFFNHHKPIGESACLTFEKEKDTHMTDTAYLLLELVPEVVQKLTDEDSNFPHLTSYQKAAHIYVSNNLPGWFKAIRDTELSLQYLAKDVVGNPLDPNANFNLEFNLQENKEESIVWVSVNGIDGKVQELYPSIAKMREKTSARYAGMYRPFSSPKMQDLFNAIEKYAENDRNNLTEKNVVCDQAALHKVDMPDEEFRELIHIVNTQAYRKIEALAFFKNHPEKLKDPDYQTFFKLFFKGGVNSTLLPQLAAFLQNAYTHYSAQNEMQTCAFLLQMARAFSPYVPHQPFFQTSLTELRRLLSKELEIEEKSVLTAELAAQLGRKSKLSEDEILELLKGTAFLNRYPVPARWEDPITKKAVRDALIIHAKSITQFFKDDNQKALNEILLAVFPSAKKQLWIHGGKLMEFASHEFYRYAPLSGQLLSPKGAAPLPVEIREHPHYRKFYPSIHEGIPCSENVYLLTDEKGVETLVTRIEDQLIIEQKREGKWFRFVPSENLIRSQENKVVSTLLSRELVHQYTHWQDLSDPSFILIVDPATQSLAYTAKHNDNQVIEIRRIKDGALLGKPSGLFNQFEGAGYVHEWFDKEENLIEVECPRFGLNFIKDPNNLQLMCQQKKGYFLDEGARHASLGSFQHYLILKNELGKELILIPKQEFNPSSEKEVLEPRYEINQQLALEHRQKQTFFTYEVKGKKELACPTVESRLYLAQVLTLVQKYDSAAILLLKPGIKLNAYTEGERKILEDLMALHNLTGDKSGNGWALRSFAAYCILNNSLAYQKELSEEVWKLAVENYKSYLKHLPHATALQLETSDERYLLKVLLERQFDPLLFVRLKQLDPAYAQTLTMPIAEKKEVESDPFKNFELKFERRRSEKSKRLYITRPGAQITENLDHYFSIALNGSEQEKETLRDCLPFLKYESAGKYFPLALLLQTVLAYPTAFSLPPGNSDDCFNKPLIKWKKETLFTASQLYKKVLTPSLEDKKIQITEEVEVIRKTVKAEQKRGRELFLMSEESEFKLYFKKTFPGKEENAAVNEMEQIVNLILKGLPSDADPLEIKEWERLEKDCLIYQSQEKPLIYSPKDEESFTELKTSILQKKEMIDSELKEDEIQILNLANPLFERQDDLIQLELWGRKRKVLTLEELFLHFGRGDCAAIMQANPALTKEKAEMLISLVGQYLIKATLSQQMGRMEKTVKEILALPKSERENIKTLTQKLALELSPRTITKPAYLVFEHAANIFLLPKQVEMIKKFLEQGDLNPVMEMIMGSGKSTVLLPLLGLLRANGKDLSMLIVPEHLFEDISTNTQKLLGVFGQKLKTLNFDRNTTFTTVSLQNILDELLTVIEEKQCLIMTSKSIKCLILKYIEKWEEDFNHGNDKNLSEELVLMRKILRVLSTSGYPILDEVDFLLSILHETNFSLGKTLSPDKEEIRLISEFYSFLYNDPDLKNIADIESTSESNSKAPALTEKLFFDKCQRLLAKKILGCLHTIPFESEAIKQSIQSFVKTLSSDKESLALDYLCRTEKRAEEAQKFYNKQDEAVQDVLALAGEELCHLLPHTLLKNSNEKYGLDEEMGGIIPLPFAAANAPNRGSQFANAYITMNYTFQIYSKKGISKSIIENEIKRLQGEAMKELQEGGNLGLENTKAWKLFSSFKGNSKMTLFNYKENELDELAASINLSFESKQAFIQRIILPQLILHADKLSCNPLNMIAFLSKVIAFTGTLCNSKSMHRKLNPKPADGTDAKTLSLLLKHSSKPAISLKARTTEEFLKELHEKGIKFNLIVDSGGYCREWENARVAQYIVKQWNEPVAYYNKAGQQVETDGNKVILLTESKTPLDLRKTFLDQVHGTGSDTTQPLNAVAIVSIGEGMVLRDLLQAVWRLRGLDNGQSVQFVVSDKVKAIINQELGNEVGEEITFISILRFTIRNQAKQQGKDNFKSLKKELRSLPQMILLGVLMHPDIPLEQQREVYKELRSTWIQPAVQRPRELFGKIAIMRETGVVIKEERKQCVADLESLFKRFSWLEGMGFKQSDLLKDVEAIIERMEGCLAARVVSPQSDDDNTVEVEQELRAEEQTQVQEHVAVVHEKKDLGLHDGWGFNRLDILNEDLFNKGSNQSSSVLSSKYALPQPYFSLKLYFEQEEALSSYAKAFEGIDLTLNVLQWPKEDPSFKDLKLFGPNRTPLNFVNINRDGTIMMVSESDAKEKGLYHTTTGIVDDNDRNLLNHEVKERLLKVRFLNGDAHYTKEEIEILRPWLKQEGAEKMSALFHKHALLGFSEKAKCFPGSALDILFKELCT